MAPLRLNKSQDESEVNMTSMSDSGGVETVMTTSGEVRDTTEVFTPKTVPEVAESLESMAMLGQPASTVSSIPTTGPVCRGCGAR